MTRIPNALHSRAERFRPQPQQPVFLRLGEHEAQVEDISRSGLCCSLPRAAAVLDLGALQDAFILEQGGGSLSCGRAEVVRAARPRAHGDNDTIQYGIRFESEQPDVVEKLRDILRPYEYVTEELSSRDSCSSEQTADPSLRTLDQFYGESSPDLFDKCERFSGWITDMLAEQYYQRLYRVTLTSGIGSRVTVHDSLQHRERVLLCFDSNSYLGLHRHPQVIESTERVLRQVGFGTPSAQLLCGTNRFLRELEQTLCDFHGREAAMVFPTGFAANSGVIRALVRSEDAVIRDQFAHASIHEACKSSDARMTKVFAHNRPSSLASVLRRAAAAGCSGKLVATDGVFSMHGKVAALPDLVEVCRSHGARLMVDDAHGVGVLGNTGRGIEEHFGLHGSVDILMGTLSKALGSLGGYICGSRDLINYLRWFAPAGLFTTSLPAPICAGVKAGLEVILAEPEHRQRLWRNIRHFVPELQRIGLIVQETQSPIVTIYVGRQKLLWEGSRKLFDAGIKCGNVIYPAVGRNDCILRFTVTAEHSLADLDYAVDVLERIGREYGVLGRTRAELQEIGKHFAARVVALAS